MVSRLKYIEKYCTNKKVLNVGCTSDYPKEEIIKNLWLHKHIENCALEVIGIDINKKLLLKCKKFSDSTMIHADATNFDLDNKFDVIVAGEIIEHLANLDGFILNIKKHLTKEGIIIITTPNAFKLKNIIYALFNRNPPGNLGHIIYFDFETIKELLNRYGLNIIECDFTTEKTMNDTLGNKLMIFIGKLFKKYNESLIIVCKQN